MKFNLRWRLRNPCMMNFAIMFSRRTQILACATSTTVPIDKGWAQIRRKSILIVKIQTIFMTNILDNHKVVVRYVFKKWVVQVILWLWTAGGFSKIFGFCINTRTVGNLNILERRSGSKWPIHFFICFAVMCALIYWRNVN